MCICVLSRRQGSLYPQEALLSLQTLFLQQPWQIFFEAGYRLCCRMLHDQILFLTLIYIGEAEWSYRIQSLQILLLPISSTTCLEYQKEI